MTGTDDLQKNFRMSVGELVQYTTFLIDTMRADLHYFAEFAVTEEKIMELELLNREVLTATQDAFYLAQLGMAIDERNAQRNMLEIRLRKLNLMAKNTFTESLSIQEGLTCKGISRLKDYDLLLSSRVILSEALKYIVQLSAEGMSQSFINELERNIEAFQAAILEVEKKKYQRSIAAGERISRANHLYKLVNKYAGYGKILFESESRAKYSVYVIHQKTKSIPAAPQELILDENAEEITWNDDSNASSYQLEESNDGINYKTVYSGSENVYKIKAAPNLRYYRVKARNIRGYGTYSDVLEVGNI